MIFVHSMQRKTLYILPSLDTVVSALKKTNQLCVLFKNIIHYTHKQSLKCRPYLNKEYPESEEEDKLDAWQVQEDTVVPYTVTDQPDTIRASDWLKVIWPWPLSIQLESQLFGREQFPSEKWYQNCHTKTIH